MLGYSNEKGATDRALDALSHPIRRRLLFTLVDKGQQASEVQVQHDEFPDVEQDILQMELYHVHLPKLDDEGYIRWNRDEMTITPGPNWENIEPLLRVIYHHLDELPPSLRGTPSSV